MKRKIIQITSGRGPVECFRVVAKVQEKMLKLALEMNVNIQILENKAAPVEGTLLSATMLATATNHCRKFVKFAGSKTGCPGSA